MPNVQNVLANDHKDLMNRVRQFITGYGTFPTPGYVGTGDGPISDVASPPPSLSETWTITCNLGGGTGVATFTVSGSVSGAQSDATVGEFYDGAGGLIEFLIKDGPADFIITDVFTVVITEGAMITAAEEWLQNRWSPAANDMATGSNFDPPLELQAMNGVVTSVVVRRGATAATLQVQYDDAVEFSQYTIFPSTGGDPSFPESDDIPEDWTVEWSDDLSGPWTIVDTVVAAGMTAGTPHTGILGSPGRHFNWRWVFTANQGGVDITIGEIGTRITGDLIDTQENGHVLLTGQGLAAADTIFVGMRIEENISVPYFTWKLQGAVAFDDTEEFDLQPDASPQTYYTVDDGTLEYWIIATGRYFIVVTKIGTIYTSMMMGLHLPYGVPAEFGYPLVICGNFQTPLHFTNTSNGFRMFANPGTGAMKMRDPAGSWLTFENRLSGTPGITRVVWPYSGSSTNTVNSFQPKVTAGIDGSYPLTSCILIETAQFQGQVGRNKNAYGELDGVFHVSGENNTAENTIVIGPDTYIMFPDIFRVTFDTFMALRLDT